MNVTDMIGDFMQSVYRELAPGGSLRVALNIGNPVLVQQVAGSGELRGMAVELAEQLAQRLSLPRVLLSFDGAGRTIEAGLAGAWDLAFLSIQPERTRHLDFTAPYVVLESTYVVRDGSPYRTVLDIDRDGVRIAVSEGGFYDLHLTRTLRRAKVVRAPTASASLELFVSAGLEAAAGLRQLLTAFSEAHPGLHVMEGRFAAVEQAIALPKGRGAALRYLNAFLEQMRSSGWVADALGRNCDLRAATLPRP